MALVRGVLVRDQLLNLTSPENHDRFETLEKILVLDSSVDVAEVLIGDVEVLHALSLVAGFSNDSHEGVQVGHELLLDVIRPLILAKELRAGLSHHLQELV